MEVQESMTSQEQITTTVDTELPETLNLTSAFGTTEHLDAIISEFGNVEAEQAFEKKVASLMNKDEFSMLFFGAGNVCHVMLGYETLLTLNPDNPQAVEAVNAVYDCIYDVPQLHWLLKPGNVWVQRAFSIGFFFVPFCMGIRKDIQAKRIEKIASRKTAVFKQKEHQHIDLSAFDKVKAA